MGNEKVYKHLTDDEWNIILKFTSDTHMDEIMDIQADENGDYFYDYEEGHSLTFEEGLSLLEDNIGTEGLVFAHYDYMLRHMIGMIFEKYSENEETKEYVRNVNSILDKARGL